MQQVPVSREHTVPYVRFAQYTPLYHHHCLFYHTLIHPDYLLHLQLCCLLQTVLTLHTPLIVPARIVSVCGAVVKAVDTVVIRKEIRSPRELTLEKDKPRDL